jgi:allantoicase
VEIDTAHFKGNFPESCELHALYSGDIVPPADHADWIPILSRTKLGPHRQHDFQLEHVADKPYTHVKLTIHPDGGVKRIRVIGTRTEDGVVGAHTTTAQPVIATDGEAETTASTTIDPSTSSSNGPVLPVLRLTAEAFAPFGQVVQAYSDPHGVPSGTKITSANQGSASKFHKLALLKQSYPEDKGATAGLSIYRCKPLPALPGDIWEIKLLERHPYTNQAFVPMSGQPTGVEGGDVLKTFGTSYLVIVAKNGEDDKPDLLTMRAFVANGGQGIVYDTGIWRKWFAFHLEMLLFLSTL